MNQHKYQWTIRDILTGIYFLAIFISMYCFAIFVVSKWGMGRIMPTVALTLVYFLLNAVMGWSCKNHLIPYFVVMLFWIFVVVIDLLLSQVKFKDLLLSVSCAALITSVVVLISQLFHASVEKNRLSASKKKD